MNIKTLLEMSQLHKGSTYFVVVLPCFCQLKLIPVCNNDSVFFLTTCRLGKGCFHCSAVSSVKVKGFGAVSCDIKVCIHRTKWKLTVHVGLLFSLEFDLMSCSKKLSSDSAGAFVQQWWCKHWFRSTQAASKTTSQADHQHLIGW